MTETKETCQCGTIAEWNARISFRTGHSAVKKRCDYMELRRIELPTSRVRFCVTFQ